MKQKKENILKTIMNTKIKKKFKKILFITLILFVQE